MEKTVTNQQKKISMIFSIVYVAFLVVGCSPSGKKEADVQEEPQELVAEEVDFWVIDEHEINDVPLTSKSKKKKATTSQIEKAEPAAGQTTYTDYEVYAIDVLEPVLFDQGYEPIETINVTEAVIPIDETQTVVSYSKKGKAQDTLQVISSGSGEIEQVIFAHKKHKDVYDVSTGMSGKEVKKLRKEMKHMVKNGQVFLYDDSSNIMYLMDAQDTEGNEIGEAEIDTMDVQAIVWKDKKHHKK